MNYEAVIAQKDAEIKQQAARIEELAHQIAQLQKLIYGRNPNVLYRMRMPHN